MNPLVSWLVATAQAATVPSIGLPQGQLSSTAANTGIAALANRVVDTLSSLAYPLAFAAIVYTAYVLITAGSSPDGWTKAKKNISYIVIGFFLIFGAVLFVRLLRSIILT
jgi:hypothetical protein